MRDKAPSHVVVQHVTPSVRGTPRGTWRDMTHHQRGITQRSERLREMIYPRDFLKCDTLDVTLAVVRRRVTCGARDTLQHPMRPLR